MKKHLILLSGLLLLIFSSPAHAQDEQIFKDALRYTVKIETRVEIPFDGDKKGFSTGAGFLLDENLGWIMTNAHVVTRSPSHISVAFYGQRSQPAEKVYVDPYLDVAILRIPPSGVGAEARSAAPDCDGFPEIGHSIGAFGHPWKFSFTGTRGIISGMTSRLGGELLQTDAPINPGNSGGPLISMRTGKVVGMNTATLDNDEDQNTNFAEPMRYLCRVFELLKEGRDPSPPDLTVMFKEDLEDRRQLVVAKSYLGPDLLPLREDDRILGIEGYDGPIENEGQLIHALRGRLDNAAIKVLRHGKPLLVAGRLNPAPLITKRKGVFVSGILLAPVQYRDRSELGHSLRVSYIEPGSIGESRHIRAWDRVLEVDDQPVASLEQLHEHLRFAHDQQRRVLLKIRNVSSRRDRIYNYKDIYLEVEDLQFLGGDSPQTLNSSS
ncbi:MAG: trypsin-like peptidase domain-containing protein [Nitrospinaceae bacterium]|nr:MAG: trypsin-like peptidase domain-containing protein [Nitrospinaceae bacterium]